MLTHGFFPDVGGLEIAVRNFARVLAEHGYAVHIIVPIKAGLAEEEIIDGIPVHRFSFDWEAAYAALLQNLGIHEFREKITRDIQAIIDEIGHPLIIHAHGEAVVAGGWLKEQNNGMKLVYTPHASLEGLKELLQAKIFGEIHFQAALEKVDIIAYHSVNLISGLKKLVDPGKIREIINFIDPNLFDPSNYITLSSRQELNLPETSPIIFSPSRVDEEKGLVELVRALPKILKKYPDVILYIAGDLTDGLMLHPSDVQHKILRKVRKVLPENTDRVRFTGTIPYQKMPKWYASSNLIVLISHDECMPMCLLEAMAMEKPIVATTVGGIPTLLNQSTGRLIEVRSDGRVSPDAVADAIIEELSQNEKRVTLKKLRERILANFSPEAGYQKLKAIYAELID